MCSEPVPGRKRHSVVNGRRSRLAPSDLWFDSNARNGPIGTDFLRPDNRRVLNLHKFKAGAQLSSNLPYTTVIFEKLYNRFSEPIWNSIDM